MSVLSIVIPVYNEKDTIQEALRQVLDAPLPQGVDREVIVIDDCSTDGTGELLKGMGDLIRLICHEVRQGKGAGVREGIRASAGDFVVIQDADLEYDPRDYTALLRPILESRAEVVYGSRFIAGRPHGPSPYWHYLGNRVLTVVSNMFTGQHLTDMETCYKMFTKRVADTISPLLVSNRFEIEPEITARIAKAGFHVSEVGISYKGRSYSEGKKIGLRDGFEALWAIIKFNLFV